MPGEIVTTTATTSMTTKPSTTTRATKLLIPAPVPAPLAERLRPLAVDAFRALERRGWRGVTWWTRASGEPYLNEVNTIPGFTPVSMYPKPLGSDGTGYPELRGPPDRPGSRAACGQVPTAHDKDETGSLSSAPKGGANA